MSHIRWPARRRRFGLQPRPFGYIRHAPPEPACAGPERPSVSLVPNRPRIERCPALTQAAQMTESPPARADAATAGGLLLGAMIVCAAVGFGLGSLVDLAVPVGLVGLFAGVVVGFALVHARYRRI